MGNQPPVIIIGRYHFYPYQAKIAEKSVHSRISTYLEDNNILYKKQGAFRKNNSTINSVSEFTINSTNTSLATFIDFLKAFGTVNHCILLEKLKKYGIKNTNLAWLQNYLAKRQQCTTINGNTSDHLYISCGVPQGSILGLLLFLVYINDLSHIITNTSMNQYADDTVLLSTKDDILSSRKKMQADLSVIANLCHINKLSLNIKKTKCMLFGSHVLLKKFKCPKLSINNINIAFVHQHQYLGVILDPKLTFNKHFNNLIKITTHKINLLSKVRQYLSEIASLTIYKTIILPYFDYGDILFIKLSKRFLKKLDQLQKRAVKLCLRPGGINPEDQLDISDDVLLKNAKVAKLDNRRDAHLLNSMYKKKECIELLDIKAVNTRARAAPLFKTKIPKCEKYKNSVFFKGATKWNSLPTKARNIDSYDSFKNLQKKNIML